MLLSRGARGGALCKQLLGLTSSAGRRAHGAAALALAPGEDVDASRAPNLALLLAALGGGLIAQVPVAHQEAQAEGGGAEDEDHPSKQQGWALLDTDTRRRMFYKYERRIRDFSHADKVFHYFASQDLPDGTRVMTPADLLRAVVAVYPAEGSADSRAGRLQGEPARASDQLSAAVASRKGTGVLKVFDADNNGISFPEYQLLLTFLTIPVQDVNVIFAMFDLNGDGSVHLHEFEQITALLQQRLRNLGSSHQRTGQKLQPSDDSKGLKRHFFGEAGNRALKLGEFAAFMASLHEALLRLEFDHYSLDGGRTISGLDFARSVCSSVDLAAVDMYLHRAAALPPALAQAKVTWTQFRHFSDLHQQVHKLAVALDFFHKVSGKLEKADFARATKLVTGAQVAPELVDIAYALFDLNGDGNLSQQELIAVLRKREGSRGDRMPGSDERPESILSCIYDCLFDRS